jgi:hypothetical protein
LINRFDTTKPLVISGLEISRILPFVKREREGGDL